MNQCVIDDVFLNIVRSSIRLNTEDRPQFDHSFILAALSLLLENNAGIEILDETYHLTPLVYCVRNSERNPKWINKLVGFLIANGADIHATCHIALPEGAQQPDNDELAIPPTNFIKTIHTSPGGWGLPPHKQVRVPCMRSHAQWHGLKWFQRPR